MSPGCTIAIVETIDAFPADFLRYVVEHVRNAPAAVEGFFDGNRKTARCFTADAFVSSSTLFGTRLLSTGFTIAIVEAVDTPGACANFAAPITRRQVPGFSRRVIQLSKFSSPYIEVETLDKIRGRVPL